MSERDVIEHGETRRDRRLRLNRLRIAVGIAVVEGVAVVAGGIPWWPTVVLAAVAVFIHLGVGRPHRRSLVRSVTWIAAVSQVAVAVVPALVAVAVALAVVVLVLVGLVVLAALLLDRR
jgi:hypothetical protein